MNTTSEYHHPGPNASNKEMEHYEIVSPLMDVLRDYGIRQEDLRAELSNILGEEITLSKVKSWFRINLKSGQRWKPTFKEIKVMNQALKNILTKKGYRFSPGSRIYLEIAFPDQRTEAEEELIKQNRVLRLTIKELEDKLKVKKSLENM